MTTSSYPVLLVLALKKQTTNQRAEEEDLLANHSAETLRWKGDQAKLEAQIARFKAETVALRGGGGCVRLGENGRVPRGLEAFGGTLT